MQTPPAPRSLRETLPRYDLRALMHTTGYGAEFVRRQSAFEYVSGPRFDGDHLVATVRDVTGRPPKILTVRVDALVPVAIGSCPNPAHGQRMCLHRLALLRDLAISPALREALAEGRPAGPALAGLDEERHRAEADARVTAALAAWQADEPQSPSLALEVVIDTGTFGWSADMEDAGLRLKVRAPPSRRVLDKEDVSVMRIPPDLRRLLALAEELGGGKSGIYIAYPRVAAAIEILRSHPEWETRGPPNDPRPVRLCVVRAQVPHEAFRQRRDPYAPREAKKGDQKPVEVLQARWKTRDGEVDLPAEGTLLFVGPTSFVVRRGAGAIHPVDGAVSIAAARKVTAEPVVEVPEGLDAAMYLRLQGQLRRTGIGLPARASMGLPEAEVPAFAVRIDGAPLDFQVLLEAEYAGGPVALSGDGLGTSAADASRNDELERAAADRLLEAGLVWDSETRRFRPGGEEQAAMFWQSGIGKLRAEGTPMLEVYLSDRLAGVRVRGALRSRVRAALVGNWLETSVSFEADDVAAEMDALRDALGRKRRWVLLRDGSIAPLATGIEGLAKTAFAALDGRGEGRLSVAQVGLLEHWASAAQDVEMDARVEQIRGRLRSLEVRPAEMPARLDATLRPYQVQGLAWLQFLEELGTGGVLADDMGLGKTLMTLAFLARRKEKGGPAPSLVVCPTSVVGNWLREAARFTPDLSVVSLAGADRAKRFDEVPKADLVVTTYALLRLDVERLQAFDFRAVVLDEAQNIKNAAAATTHAARRLRAEQRLALTGTPVENRLGELWSILEFCNPGMLGSDRSFHARFERPVAEEPGGPAAAELRARVRPFVLRRAKAQVLADLPPKQEIDVPCLPGQAQRRAYDALAEVVRRDVESSIATRGFSQSGIIVLTALLRLRQMCCDPRLVDPSRPAAQSAKREAFLSLVRELTAEGRRALVFSQFVELLHLWRADLDREGIAYEYLDGSTQRREEVVSRFQDGRAPLFLLSLKAGGSGLNLTAADTVIHCDPWWNPAVEAQATDRTHRIGQTRSVTVYRLVLRGTIEERIAELKAKKRAIADAVIREDAAALRGLEEEDVRALLSGVETSSLEASPEIDVADAPRT